MCHFGDFTYKAHKNKYDANKSVQAKTEHNFVKKNAICVIFCFIL